MDVARLIDLPFADPAMLRTRARAAQAMADQTRRLAALLDARVSAVPYEGPAARAFRARMGAHHIEALRVSAGLEDVAHRLAAVAATLPP